ncbi:hypothetical protein LCGC14_0888270 [marine sediment metagenome]|uniref:Uncharacterized protein n=1 Tax=marine sediment metagenome TaxID=412755 RepID=A0A0F9P007_9ZZZZ
MPSGKKHSGNSYPYDNIKSGAFKKMKGKENKGWILCFFACMCLAVIAVLAIVSVLLNRDIRDNDDDGQSVSLNSIVEFLGNPQQTDDFIRCLSGCGAGLPTQCRDLPGCLDKERCGLFCGRPGPMNNCRNSSDCNGNTLCDEFCFQRLNRPGDREECLRECM